MPSFRVPKDGTPVEAKLAHDPSKAKTVPSQYTPGGVQHCYRLHNCDPLYLSPENHQTLFDLGARAGDTVQLRREGQEIHISLVSEPAPTPEPTLIRVEGSQNGATSFLPKGTHTQTAVPRHLPPVVMGAAAPAIQPQATADTKPLHRPGAQIMAGAGFTAIDAVIAIEEYARAKGRPIHFTEDSIERITVTLFIAAKNGEL